MHVYLIINLVQKLLHEIPSRYLAERKEQGYILQEGYTFWLDARVTSDGDTILIYEGENLHDMESVKLGKLCHYCGEFTYEFEVFCSEACNLSAQYDYFDEVKAEMERSPRLIITTEEEPF